MDAAKTMSHALDRFFAGISNLIGSKPSVQGSETPKIDDRIHFVAKWPMSAVAQCLYDPKTDVTETLVMDGWAIEDGRPLKPYFREHVDFRNRHYVRKDASSPMGDMSVPFDKLDEGAQEFLLTRYRPATVAAHL